MTASPEDRIEAQLVEFARRFPYPPTPDISRQISRRLDVQPALRPGRPRLAWAVVLLLVILGTLLAVPPVRAAIVEFIQVGVVRIFLAEPAGSPTPSLSPTRGGEAGGAPSPIERSGTALPASPGGVGEATRLPSPTGRDTPAHSTLPAGEAPGVRETLPPTPYLLPLSGKTTLEDAIDRLNFPVLLPTYPAGLPAPDGIFLQDLDGQVLVLVWMDPGNLKKVRFSLHQMEPGNFSIDKVEPEVVEETTIHGKAAYWTTGPYLLRMRTGDLDFLRLIDGHVLIWTEGEITYRLETDLPLDEAIRIAESLAPITR